MESAAKPLANNGATGLLQVNSSHGRSTFETDVESNYPNKPNMSTNTPQMQTASRQYPPLFHTVDTGNSNKIIFPNCLCPIGLDKFPNQNNASTSTRLCRLRRTSDKTNCSHPYTQQQVLIFELDVRIDLGLV